MPKPLVIAHRGASRVTPENTIAALSEAVALGAVGVEVDIRATADGVPVLLTTRPSTARRTAAATSRRSRGPKCNNSMPAPGSILVFAGEHIPSLESTFDWAKPQPGLRLFLEIKGRAGQYPGLVESLYVALSQDPALAARTYVIAFDPWWIARLRELLPSALTGLIYSERPSDNVAATAHRLRTNALLPRLDALTPDGAAQAHRAGLEVFPWTANTMDEIKGMLSVGVDGLITDDVALARRMAAS
jgi:glycerophosphoryl diester phosphodiesterase